jgi:hypothetical protein
VTAVVSPNAAPYLSLITSEHNQQPNFMALVGVLAGAMADCVAAMASIPPAFNLQTAIGAQLDIIGLWVGQPRIVPYILIPGFFGFSALQTGLPEGLALTFGDLRNPSIGGVWYGLGEAATGNTQLNDAQYRTVLVARIVRNQSNGTLSDIEQGLLDIFGAACSVIDNGGLNIAIIVSVPITPVDQALLTALDILPRPAGVNITNITYTP